MNLSLFENRKLENKFVNKFIEELKNSLENAINKPQSNNEMNNDLNEYNRYERQKIFLDNKTRKSNELAWVIDENSVCISENGDGGPISIREINLPENAKIGEVYEKIEGEYVYNPDITMQLKEIE